MSEGGADEEAATCRDDAGVRRGDARAERCLECGGGARRPRADPGRCGGTDTCRRARCRWGAGAHGNGAAAGRRGGARAGRGGVGVPAAWVVCAARLHLRPVGLQAGRCREPAAAEPHRGRLAQRQQQVRARRPRRVSPASAVGRRGQLPVHPRLLGGTARWRHADRPERPRPVAAGQVLSPAGHLPALPGRRRRHAARQRRRHDPGVLGRRLGLRRSHGRGRRRLAPPRHRRERRVLGGAADGPGGRRAVSPTRLRRPVDRF